MNSLISWMGGKRLLARTILALLPEHKCYVEVFGGAGWVLFAKEPSPTEVYNDLDGRLVALFRSVKHHPDELVRELEHLLPSREVFDCFRAQPGLTEIQQAARFYYVLKMSFGSRSRTFGYAKVSPKRLLLERLQVRMEDVRQRLAGVTIERGDFAVILQRYDGPDTAFFIDPPYVDAEQYAVQFSVGDHERLATAVAGLQAKWLMTYGDHPWVRQAYARWRLHEVVADYTLPGAGRQPGHQLIITNYRLTRAQLRAAPRTVTPVPKPRKRRT